MDLVDQFLQDYAKYSGLRSTEPTQIALELCELQYYTPHVNTDILKIAFGWFWAKCEETERANCLVSNLLDTLNEAHSFKAYRVAWITQSRK